MSSSSRHTAVPTVYAHTGRAEALTQDHADPVQILAARLAGEMAAAWRRGERPRAEEFLARHAELSSCPEAAVQVIYEEICLCQECGLEMPTREVVGRFPQWQTELELLLDCHRLMHDQSAEPDFPRVGESFGDFHLRAELGRGAQGRVFLATQPALADRPVVLKLMPRDNPEHLALARLQHPHVMPLYWVQEHRNLRVLCLPYLGGATLACLLKTLAGQPPEERTGRDLLDALDRAASAWSTPCRSPARQFLAGASYVQAICWIGACLADALSHIHANGLVHLDLKPSNVLLSASGQPVLFDFHLARPPLRPEDPVPEWFGGTPAYLSPEQRQALQAVRQRRPVAVPVEGRSDIYSLGLLLYEALGKATAEDDGEHGGAAWSTYREAREALAEAPRPRLEACNAEVDGELANVIHCCLAEAPEERFADAAALAEELRHYAEMASSEEHHLDNTPCKHL